MELLATSTNGSSSSFTAAAHIIMSCFEGRWELYHKDLADVIFNIFMLVGFWRNLYHNTIITVCVVVCIRFRGTKCGEIFIVPRVKRNLTLAPGMPQSSTIVVYHKFRIVRQIPARRKQRNLELCSIESVWIAVMGRQGMSKRDNPPLNTTDVATTVHTFLRFLLLFLVLCVGRVCLKHG